MDFLDKDGSGNVDFNEFLVGLRVNYQKRFSIFTIYRVLLIKEERW